MAAMTEYQHVTADMSVYRDGTIKLHGPEGVRGMRKAGRLAAEILDALVSLVEPACRPRRSTARCAR
jgi:methionyl aminopeptidase